MLTSYSYTMTRTLGICLKKFDINFFQVFRDVFTKRELNALCLHCSNQGCPWHDTYDALEVSWGGKKEK